MSDCQLIGGMKVVVQKPYQVKVKRTWKDRLFTLPWLPLESHKTELHETVNDGDFLIDKVNNVIYCNEKMYQKLIAAKL